MINRIIIAGCRNYENYEEAKEYIEACLESFSMSDQFVLLSGHCRGADQLGERFAREKGWEIIFYPAQWDKFGRAASPVRNREMVIDCDAVICFWAGKSKGTGSLLRLAEASGKPVWIKIVMQ